MPCCKAPPERIKQRLRGFIFPSPLGCQYNLPVISPSLPSPNNAIPLRCLETFSLSHTRTHAHTHTHTHFFFFFPPLIPLSAVWLWFVRQTQNKLINCPTKIETSQ